jgi:hypothetical protein
MKNKTNLLLAPYGFRNKFFYFKKNQKNKDSSEISPKNIPVPSGSGIRDLVSEIRYPEKIHPGSGSRTQGVKKHRIPDPDPQH